ncbi:MAG: ABC transporter [Deltaproteobacteria bacterium GWC2_42_51]|nr:MAG: ABC transporter [Deltaproteobacteria bacterium GWA2_42_85]OGP31832.1 MAG: ABC transporter [Deltaproteobacteria bacterium GWC2_42_51]OGP38050.1 MAG: ABC transporter [Deltaproteobacteria bacterium GWD2_42_10]OGP47614.1 MAG: ABC transporter [Deltaproteobacteria bacterium GWF2_42_12]OGQ30320.1 MAG: ABC transporter [Deltaproteobacteria bacterium RIFCSPHIGHO2_02_FULL_42_44]OGQ35636.1 MAG: ABC transporter [Deltaproteobacteria bacterium RIFCSPLOWO2_02_FULL_42_39]OGQ70823.1 MAG: ABC transporte
MKIHRVLALVIRHLYLYKRSIPRLMEVFYWPFLDLVIWGFITIYLTKFKGTLPDFIAFLLGALILWDILFRSQQGLSVSFLEDMWARNLLNIFVSPIRPIEYIFALMLVSIVKLLLASIVMVIFAWLFYSFNIFLLGLSLIPMIVNLVIMGWGLGIITMALILRLGQEAEVLAWAVAFLFQPVSAVFYPVSVLPPFLQTIAQFIPASHIFEGMRIIISGGGFPMHDVLWATALNFIYILTALVFFYWNFSIVRRKGLLARIGE